MKTYERLLADTIPVPTKLKNIRIGKHTIHYLEAGRGKPLLLFHGINIGWGQWYPNIAALSRKFHVFALDLPGAGYSPSSENRSLNLEQHYIKPIEAFVNIMKLKKPILVGHSFSSSVLVHLARRKKISIDSLVLTNPIGLTKNLPPQQAPIGFALLAQFLARVAMRPSTSSMHSFLTSVMQKKDTLSHVFVLYYTQAILENRTLHPLLFLHSLTHGVQFHQSLVFSHLLSDISIPTHIIYGEKDPLMKPAPLLMQHNMNRFLTWTPLSDIGHVPNLEDPKLFHKTLFKHVQ